MKRNATDHRGFSLVELMVVLAIFALGLTMASPMITTYLENSKVRNVTDSIATGMQKARVNAVKKNTLTQFVLAADSWTVQELDTTTTPASVIVPTNEVFDWGAGTHNWTNIAVVSSPANLSIVTFDGVGRMLAQNPATNLTAATNPPNFIDVQQVRSMAGVAPLRVQVSMARGIRTCVPMLPVGDPKACS